MIFNKKLKRKKTLKCHLFCVLMNFNPHSKNMINLAGLIQEFKKLEGEVELLYRLYKQQPIGNHWRQGLMAESHSEIHHKWQLFVSSNHISLGVSQIHPSFLLGGYLKNNTPKIYHVVHISSPLSRFPNIIIHLFFI